MSSRTVPSGAIERETALELAGGGAEIRPPRGLGHARTRQVPGQMLELPSEAVRNTFGDGASDDGIRDEHERQDGRYGKGREERA